MRIQSIKLPLSLICLSFAFLLTCEDKITDSGKFGAVHVKIVFNNDNSQNNKQSTNNGIKSFLPKNELFRTIGKNIKTDETAEENIQGLHTEKDVKNSVLNKSLSGDITSITITISGVDPVNVDVSSGETVSKTIDGVPVGEQTVKIDLKNSAGTIIYTQTQTVEVAAGETSSPSFPAEDFTPENVSITVTSPNGGETWQLGTTHDITWNSSHSGLNVKIELYKSVSSYQTISSSQTNDGSYSWAIPSSYDEADNYKIRISYVSDGNVYDDGDNAFSLTSIPQPTITVTSPNGGETWELGSTHDITWSSADVSGNVKIELYKAGSANQIISGSTSNSGSYSWTIPTAYEAGSDYTVRISSVSDATVYDESDNTFNLSSTTQETITVTSPNGGEEWEIGSTYNITWTSSGLLATTLSPNDDNNKSEIDYMQKNKGNYLKVSKPKPKRSSNIVTTSKSLYVIENVKIELYQNGSAYQIIEGSTDNDSSYSWTIPSSYNAGTDYKIRISSVSDATVYDESDANFELSPAPTITVTSPNGGEDWELGSTQDITWTSGDVSGNVKIELYQNGSAYQIIEGSTDNDSSYSWTIPSSYDAGTDYKVRISSVSDATVYDESDANFTLFSGTQQLTWSYTFGDSAKEYFYDMQKTADGGYIFWAGTNGGCSNFLLKINADGEVELYVCLEEFYNMDPVNMKQTTDGGYIISYTTINTFNWANHKSFIRKYDSQGIEEWYQMWWGNAFGDDYGDKMKYVDITSDGGYIMVGYTSYNDGGNYLRKLDSDGEDEFLVDDAFSWGGSPIRVHETNTTGEYIIAGNSSDTGYLSKTYANATEAWTQIIDFTITDLLITDGDEYILLGYTVEDYIYETKLVKTDSQGNELWNSSYDGNVICLRVTQTTDGGYIMSGNTYDTPRDAVLLKTDSQGNLEWQSNHGGLGSEVAVYAFQSDDGGYVFGGYTSSFGNGWYEDHGNEFFTHYNDLWLVKTDSEGNTSE